jgi:1-acyl-sn-glycerol-3-phosphate acyltransferase
MFYGTLKLLSRVILRLCFRQRAVGVEHVPAVGPVLLAANHVSFLDPPAIGAPVGRQLHYLAKQELFGMPLVGGLIRRLNAHPVAREQADAAALRLALSLLKAGHALLVFPEGTRGTEGALGEGRAGVGMLAALAGVPVVPVFVEGTGRALPRGASFPRPARITVAYGPPLTFERQRGKQRYQAVSDAIMAAIARLRDEVARQRTMDPTATRALSAGRIH